MAEVIELPERGFRFVKGVFQYSAGVAALPGWRLERARFARTVPLAEGFARIAAHLDAAGLPRTAFAACELRSPAPFTEAGFVAFNRAYYGVLEQWGVPADGLNQVARANVCPEIDPPDAPGFHAFSYAVPAPDAAPSFVVAGSGEAQEGRGNYRDFTTALGDVSPAGIRAKARWVLGEMERRMGALGFGWADATGVQVYTVHDIAPFFAEELVRRGAARHGATWQYCRPPVVDLEFEMDCRGVHRESVLAG
ncbi:MAG: hypothetical protein ABS99_06720 [Acetobacteraceae bacterium SCN 69-10]|nr:hypothetical protein [Rhodospirillales bacterium]ODU55885.1 MAG: hypothetical protein ABS99_06720 [Acetobacteraceae bacterium SCN 69-10]OJY63443.1 MAG: hypothetical protein BGP12_10415 [Rhodospirillales bacterium 70-18]